MAVLRIAETTRPGERERRWFVVYYRGEVLGTICRDAARSWSAYGPRGKRLGHKLVLRRHALHALSEQNTTVAIEWREYLKRLPPDLAQRAADVVEETIEGGRLGRTAD